MLRSWSALLPIAFAIAGGVLSAACAGNLLPESIDGGSGSSSGSASSSGVVSSSGFSSSSSSGVTSSSSSSSGVGSSSGSPGCGDLAVPAIAEQCPDGSYASPTYVLENGECVLTLICPPCEGPCTSPTPPEPPPPSPPACTAA